MFGIEKCDGEKVEMIYRMLLKKYMSHIMSHESISYTSDSKLK